MAIIVQKFGGTSLADVEKIKNVVKQEEGVTLNTEIEIVGEK